jgi:hypothetical protein
VACTTTYNFITTYESLGGGHTLTTLHAELGTTLSAGQIWLVQVRKITAGVATAVMNCLIANPALGGGTTRSCEVTGPAPIPLAVGDLLQVQVLKAGGAPANAPFKTYVTITWF